MDRYSWTTILSPLRDLGIIALERQPAEKHSLAIMHSRMSYPPTTLYQNTARIIAASVMLSPLTIKTMKARRTEKLQKLELAPHRVRKPAKRVNRPPLERRKNCSSKLKKKKKTKTRKRRTNKSPSIGSSPPTTIGRLIIKYSLEDEPSHTGILIFKTAGHNEVDNGEVIPEEA